MVINIPSFCHFEVGGTWEHIYEIFISKGIAQAHNFKWFILLFYFILVLCYTCTMAEADRKHYNLSSGSDSVKLPTHLQLSDSEFLASIVDNDQDSDSGESCGSALNCSAVIENSDNEEVNKHNTPSTSSISHSTSQVQSSLSDVAVQQAINVKILSQLSAISDRLNALEKTNVKKDSDPKKIKGASKKKTSSHVTPVTVPPTGLQHFTVQPTGLQNPTVPPTGLQHFTVQPTGLQNPTVPPTGLPNLSSLRQDAYIQSQVDQRLRDLANTATSGTKIKSLRGGPVEVVVPNRVKWPQEFVLSGSKKERIQYDQLSIVQWVAGFCRILREETNSQTKEHMLDYLISLMEDANDFSWDAARASHAVLLCRMEQGEVTGYNETDKLDRIRRENAQRHLPTPSNDSYNFSKKSKVNKTLTCSYFNQGTCMHQKSHDNKGVMYRHICSYCFQQTGKTYPHSEQNCRNKNAKKIGSKNE